jgi:hypothetical protein
MLQAIAAAEAIHIFPSIIVVYSKTKAECSQIGACLFEKNAEVFNC